ncbi:MAG: hypothetical protein EAX96_07940 [Candidatus Lokiarchaeota archaeon]|nr:hypothetical protein [Candidatus Lokiarchaeota archaeon]
MHIFKSMITLKIKIIGSLQPDVSYLKDIISHSMVSGIRFNTAIPFEIPKRKILYQFKKKIFPKKLWVDLKCRELRIKEQVTIPNDLIELNHQIEIKTPTIMYYNEGEKYLVIDEIINGNKLKIRIPKNAPNDFKICFGKSASVNIPEVQKIYGYLTDNDREYIQAALENDIHDFMISYVEDPSDIKEVLELDPNASIIAKIESEKGLEFVKSHYNDFKEKVHLMVARGDLYIELDRPHKILNAMKIIIEKDPDAIAASRILLSVLNSEQIPNCTDICDIGFILQLGYKNLLLGDHVCEDESTLKNAIGILEAIQNDFLNS